MGKSKKQPTEAGAESAPASTDESAVATWAERSEAQAIKTAGACFAYLQKLRHELSARATDALTRGDHWLESALGSAEKATLRAIEKLRAGRDERKPGEVLQAA